MLELNFAITIFDLFLSGINPPGSAAQGAGLCKMSQGSGVCLGLAGAFAQYATQLETLCQVWILAVMEVQDVIQN